LRFEINFLIKKKGKLILKSTAANKVNEVTESNQEIREYETVANVNSSENFGYSLIKPTTAGLPARKLSLIEILTSRDRKIGGEKQVNEDEASVDHQVEEEMDLKTYNNSNLISDRKGAIERNEAIGFKFNILNSLIISILFFIVF
jgi:hypothetical protein